jgi:hypothetical protein
MYSLRVKTYRHGWRWSLRRYKTLQEAQARVQELAQVGIKAIISIPQEEIEWSGNIPIERRA